MCEELKNKEITETMYENKEIQVEELKDKEISVIPESQQPLTTQKAEIKKSSKTKIRKTITDVEFKELTAKNVPEPDFEVLKKEQLSKLSKKQKEEYNKKLTAFDEKVQKWVESETKRKETASLKLHTNLEGETWPSIEATPEAMDEALKQNTVDELESKELSKNEYKLWLRGGNDAFKADNALQQYMQSTNICDNMNNYLRFGDQEDFMAKMFADQGVEGMKNKTTTRDMVSRRGTRGYGALSGMLGLDTKMKPDELRGELERRVEGGEDIVLTEKGFCSTSLKSDAGYDCGQSGGIEFIILAKKGTCGVDYRVGGSRETEQELLIGAGTKFKLVKAYFGDRDAFLGKKGSWKIYLESIPQGDNNGVTV